MRKTDFTVKGWNPPFRIQRNARYYVCRYYAIISRWRTSHRIASYVRRVDPIVSCLAMHNTYETFDSVSRASVCICPAPLHFSERDLHPNCGLATCVTVDNHPRYVISLFPLIGGFLPCVVVIVYSWSSVNIDRIANIDVAGFESSWIFEILRLFFAEKSRSHPTDGTSGSWDRAISLLSGVDFEDGIRIG